MAKCGIIQELKNYDDDELTVTHYYNWMDHSKICKVPHVLINPWFIKDLGSLSPAERYLARYSTNSGTALGLTTEDSVLHGLSEEIERHYLSHFYLKEAGFESDFTFQELKLSKDSWLNKSPYDSMLDRLSKYQDYKIIISMTLFMSFSLVIARPFGGETAGMSVLGSGASYNPREAIRRALGEFTQSHELLNAEAKKNALDVSLKLKKSPKLTALISLLNRSYPEIPVMNIPNKTIIGASTRSLVDSVVRQLNDHDYSVFFRFLNPRYDDVIVTSVYIPGFERFHLARSGNIVAPQKWLLRDHH